MKKLLILPALAIFVAQAPFTQAIHEKKYAPEPFPCSWEQAFENGYKYEDGMCEFVLN